MTERLAEVFSKNIGRRDFIIEGAVVLGLGFWVVRGEKRKYEIACGLTDLREGMVVRWDKQGLAGLDRIGDLYLAGPETGTGRIVRDRFRSPLIPDEKTGLVWARIEYVDLNTDEVESFWQMSTNLTRVERIDLD